MKANLALILNVDQNKANTQLSVSFQLEIKFAHALPVKTDPKPLKGGRRGREVRDSRRRRGASRTASHDCAL